MISTFPQLLRHPLHVLRQHASRRSFAWNVSVMLIGTVVGQAISLLLTPILTRLFSPSEFGYLGVYTSVLAMLAVVGSLSLELAIPICLGEREYANLLALCGLLLAGMTALLGVLCWLAPAGALARLSLDPLVGHWTLLPIGLALLGGYYVLVAAATRSGAFRDIAHTRISQGLGGPLSQITCGLAGWGATGLVIGYLIGQGTGTLLLLRRVVFAEPAKFRAVSRRGIVAVATRYRGFPLYASWTRLLDLAGDMVLFVLFTAFYSSSVVGFIFLSQRVIMRPLTVVSTSLLQVFTGEAGRAISHDPALLRRRFYQVVPKVFGFAAAWVLIGNLLAVWAFPLLFGSVWIAAVPYLRAFSIAGLLFAVLHPVSTTLQLLEYQVTAALWQIGRVLLVILGVVLPWHEGFSPLTALWIVSAIQAACCLLLLFLMVRAIEQTTARHRTLATGAA